MRFLNSRYKKIFMSVLINVFLFVSVSTAGFYSVRIYEHLTAPPAFSHGDYAKYYGDIKNDKILFYSTSWCPVCKETRAYLKKNNFPYVERDVEQVVAWAADMKELNTNAVPLLITKGHVIYGFRPKLIEEIMAGSESRHTTSL